MVGGRAEPGRGDQQHADGQHPDEERHQRGHRERGVAAGVRQGQHEQRQAGGGHDHADPLARADLAAEQPLAEHREHHDAGRERHLDERERREGERRDVQDPGAGRDRHAENEPARAEQAADALQRRAQLDARRQRRAAVLAQEPELRDGRAQERKPDTDVQSLSSVALTQECRGVGGDTSGRLTTFSGRRCGFLQRRLSVPAPGVPGTRTRVQAPATRGAFAPTLRPKLSSSPGATHSARQLCCPYGPLERAAPQEGDLRLARVRDHFVSSSARPSAYASPRTT